MAFPRAFLDQLKSRTSIADIVSRTVRFDAKKSNPAKGDYWACCPFHGEKTPSFHVHERDGYYHCFGCKESGTAIDFLMKIEKMSFPEAVRTLAEQAGMPLPETDAKAAAAEQRAKGLVEAMEAAARWYGVQLRSARGGEARAYLDRRGLSDETIARFGLGYAPEARDALTRHLLDSGFARETLVEAGLSGLAEESGALYDRFRNRVIFPIRDPRDRCIAFGGRALRDGPWPKYLNSQETPLFNKSRVLFNHGPARAASRGEAAVVVVEGYMDVIALAQAGIDTAVAPLGTAMTAEHLTHLWRMSDEPVIALDGDEAGARAAERAARVALSGLQPGKTLGFVTLPGGLDPDDFIRQRGAEAFRALLAEATPLIETLWRAKVAEARLDIPEGRARFDGALREMLGEIRDPDVRRHYGDAIRERRAGLFDSARPAGGGAQSGPAGGFPPQGGGRVEATHQALTAPFQQGRRPGGGAGFGGARRNGSGGWGGFKPPIRASQETMRWAAANAPGNGAAPPNSGVAPDDASGATALKREALILLVLLNHPHLVLAAGSELEDLSFEHAHLDSFKTGLISAVGALEREGSGPDALTPEQMRDRMVAKVGRDAVAQLMRSAGAPIPRAAEPGPDVDAAEACLRELLDLHAKQLTWRRERDEFASEFATWTSDGDEEDAAAGCARLRAARDAAAVDGDLDQVDSGDKDREDSKRLQSFIDAKPWIKKPKSARG